MPPENPSKRRDIAVFNQVSERIVWLLVQLPGNALALEGDRIFRSTFGRREAGLPLSRTVPLARPADCRPDQRPMEAAARRQAGSATLVRGGAVQPWRQHVPSRPR